MWSFEESDVRGIPATGYNSTMASHDTFQNHLTFDKPQALSSEGIQKPKCLVYLNTSSVAATMSLPPSFDSRIVSKGFQELSASQMNYWKLTRSQRRAKKEQRLVDYQQRQKVLAEQKVPSSCEKREPPHVETQVRSLNEMNAIESIQTNGVNYYSSINRVTPINNKDGFASIRGHQGSDAYQGGNACQGIMIQGGAKGNSGYPTVNDGASGYGLSQEPALINGYKATSSPHTAYSQNQPLIASPGVSQAELRQFPGLLQYTSQSDFATSTIAPNVTIASQAETSIMPTTVSRSSLSIDVGLTPSSTGSWIEPDSSMLSPPPSPPLRTLKPQSASSLPSSAPSSAPSPPSERADASYCSSDCVEDLDDDQETSKPSSMNPPNATFSAGREGRKFVVHPNETGLSSLCEAALLNRAPFGVSKHSTRVNSFQHPTRMLRRQSAAASERLATLAQSSGIPRAQSSIAIARAPHSSTLRTIVRPDFQSTPRARVAKPVFVSTESHVVAAPNLSTQVTAAPRHVCMSCGTKQTPCWRPSWDSNLGQLCNSCGLRFRKTRIRCSSATCAYVPSKLDLASIRNKNLTMTCFSCKSHLVHDVATL